MSWARAFLIAALPLLATLAPGSARAGFWDGNELFSVCEKLSEPCFVYLMGVADTVNHKGLPMAQAYVTTCLPEGTTGRQLRDVVMKLLETQPESFTQSAAFIAAVSMAQAWPCPK